jgi:acyl carrier protein phosphodiesterase
LPLAKFFRFCCDAALNWLAHLYLSDANPVFRIGNLLPDLAPAQSLKSLPDDFQRGIQRHHRIDAFTDSHPVVHESIRRFPPHLRRFGGILTDLFYDHFLACDWSRFSSVSLRDFTDSFYASVPEFRAIIPAQAYIRLEQMREADWLTSYAKLPGIARAVERIGLRFRQPVDLTSSITTLEQDYHSFHADFENFFPQLRAYIGQAPSPV